MITTTGLRRLLAASLLAGLLSLPSFAVAQDEPLEPGPSPAPVALEPGTSWQVLSFDGWGAGLVEPVPGSTLEVSLLSDGRLEGETACGRYSGGYFLDGDQLSMGIVSRPFEACSQGETEETVAFSTALDLVASWRVGTDGSGLELLDAGDRVRVVLQRPTVSDPTGDWLVDGYVRPNGRQAEPSPDFPMRLAISADGRVTGSTGCSFFEGEYRGEGDAIFIGPIELIGQPCEGPLRRPERQLLRAIEQVTRWQRDGDSLVLIDAFETPMLELSSAPAAASDPSPLPQPEEAA